MVELPAARRQFNIQMKEQAESQRGTITLERRTVCERTTEDSHILGYYFEKYSWKLSRRQNSKLVYLCVRIQSSKNRKIVDIGRYRKINSGVGGERGGRGQENIPGRLDALPACILNAPEMLQIDAFSGGRQKLFVRRGRLMLVPAGCWCFCRSFCGFSNAENRLYARRGGGLCSRFYFVFSTLPQLNKSHSNMAGKTRMLSLHTHIYIRDIYRRFAWCGVYVKFNKGQRR